MAGCSAGECCSIVAGIGHMATRARIESQRRPGGCARWRYDMSRDTTFRRREMRCYIVESASACPRLPSQRETRRVVYGVDRREGENRRGSPLGENSVKRFCQGFICHVQCVGQVAAWAVCAMPMYGMRSLGITDTLPGDRCSLHSHHYHSVYRRRDWLHAAARAAAIDVTAVRKRRERRVNENQDRRSAPVHNDVR